MEKFLRCLKEAGMVGDFLMINAGHISKDFSISLSAGTY